MRDGSLFIDTYDIEIQHRRGAQHKNADGLYIEIQHRRGAQHKNADGLSLIYYTRYKKDRKTKSIVVHVDHLKQYIGEKIPPNWEETVNNDNTDNCETDKNTNTLPAPIKTRSGRTVKSRKIFSP